MLAKLLNVTRRLCDNEFLFNYFLLFLSGRTGNTEAAGTASREAVIREEYVGFLYLSVQCLS